MCIPITVAFKPSDGYFIKGNIASHIWFLFEQKAEKNPRYGWRTPSLSANFV